MGKLFTELITFKFITHQIVISTIAHIPRISITVVLNLIINIPSFELMTSKERESGTYQCIGFILDIVFKSCRPLGFYYNIVNGIK